MVSCLEPVFSILIAAIALGEVMKPLQTLGIVMVLAAILLVQMPDRKWTNRSGGRADRIGPRMFSMASPCASVCSCNVGGSMKAVRIHEFGDEKVFSMKKCLSRFSATTRFSCASAPVR